MRRAGRGVRRTVGEPVGDGAVVDKVAVEAKGRTGERRHAARRQQRLPAIRRRAGRGAAPGDGGGGGGVRGGEGGGGGGRGLRRVLRRAVGADTAGDLRGVIAMAAILRELRTRTVRDVLRAEPGSRKDTCDFRFWGVGACLPGEGGGCLGMFGFGDCEAMAKS